MHKIISKTTKEAASLTLLANDHQCKQSHRLWIVNEHPGTSDWRLHFRYYVMAAASAAAATVAAADTRGEALKQSLVSSLLCRH